jgi:alkylation response protein AidB-like acyl-CoA dehydrogenase
MDLRFTPEENAFRQEVRTFMTTEVPLHVRKKTEVGEGLSKADLVASHKALAKKGWAAPHWPKQYGGTGWTPIQHHIFTEELQANSVPQPLPFNVSMCGPVIIAFGTEEQKKKFLPGMYNLDDWWCQGFSEPGAGSDLAGLKTACMSSTARRPGRRWRSTPTGASCWRARTWTPRSRWGFRLSSST